MDYSRKISERLWNLPDKGERESRRSGRFSIFLAKHGCNVTHFDISQPMINKAKELAERERIFDKITFVKGALEDLKDFDDKSFDMVISFDAPISYTHPHQEQVIGELVRICKKHIVISVSSRLGSLPFFLIFVISMILIRLYAVLEKTTYWLKGSCKVKQ